MGSIHTVLCEMQGDEQQRSDAGIPEDGWIPIKLLSAVKTVDATNRRESFRIVVLAPQSPE